MSNTTSIRLGASTKKWIASRLNNKETFSGYIHNLIREDMKNSISGLLYLKINEVMFDLDERLNEVYDEVSSGLSVDMLSKAKEEIGELNEFKLDLTSAQNDILNNDIDDSEAQQLVDDIDSAQRT